MNEKRGSRIATDASLAVCRYRKLVSDISLIYEGAQKSVVKAYWDIGKQLVEVEQEGAVRAAYGTDLIDKISDELTRKHGSSGLSGSNLRRMRQLYLCFPHLDPTNGLTWSHYVEILPLEDRAAQERILQQVLRENLGIRQIRQLVRREYARRRSAGNGALPELLTPIRGKTGIHEIVCKAGELYLDLGFRNFSRLTPGEASRFKEGMIVEWGEDGDLRELPDAAGSDLHTYEARLDGVCDGDTQWYFIFTGLPPERRQSGGERSHMKNDKLRLRGIDCPELGTPEGEAAKRFAEALFSRAVKATVTTTKPDKYDRYLSDVFLQMPDGRELFLNNELLSAGHAALYEVAGPVDWGE
jgi:endonuclease YncB( thermonuclease family)